MAFNARRNLQARTIVPLKQKVAPREARPALGYIHNKISNQLKNVPVETIKVAPQKGVPARIPTHLQKENHAVAKPPCTFTSTVREAEVKDLNDSLMDVSLTDPEGFSSCMLPAGISDIDSKDLGNQLLCSDLVMDIYRYLRELEKKWSIRKNFLSKQRDITPRMRAILVDWLNQVHNRFDLIQETLQLTVAVIDRFLQEHEVSRKQLQLVGVTAMFIASKYEEMYAPVVEDFVFITDNAYSKRDIFKMECLILQTLQFSFGRPLPLHFLRRDSKAAACSPVVHAVAKFMMEISFQDYELAAVPPSMLAAAALRLSLKVMEDAPWTPDLAFYAGYREEELTSVMAPLAKLILMNSGSKLQAVHKKYASSKFMKVSTLPEIRSDIMELIAQGVATSRSDK